MTITFNKLELVDGYPQLIHVKEQVSAAWLSSDDHHLIMLGWNVFRFGPMVNESAVHFHDVVYMRFREQGRVIDPYSRRIVCRRDGSSAFVVKMIMDLVMSMEYETPGKRQADCAYHVYRGLQAEDHMVTLPRFYRYDKALREYQLKERGRKAWA